MSHEAATRFVERLSGEGRLTAEQRLAVCTASSSVILSAGAGCGKTATLSTRFLCESIGREMPGGQVLAMTFTDKAARELRERVRWIGRQQARRDDEDAERWRTLVRRLEAATIGTIHAFCGDLLRRFSLEAGLDPGFGVLEETIAPSVREVALGRCLRGWLETRHPDLMALAASQALTDIRDAIATLIVSRTRGDLAAFARESPASILASWQRIFEGEIVPALRQDAAQMAEDMVGLIDALSGKSSRMQERLLSMRAAILDLHDAADLEQALQTLREGAKIQGDSAKKWDNPGDYELAKETLEALRKFLDKCREQLRWDPAATEASIAQGQRLARLSLHAIAAYDAEKRQRGVIDFDDLLWHARALLHNPPDVVRQYIDQEIGHVLVDEFQDTDPIQAQIITALVGGDQASGKLFVVGDLKQSIYRFRGARAELFLGFRERMPAEGRQQLTGNFRSVPELLDFFNALFGGTFREPEHRLVPGSTEPPRSDRGAVECLWAHDPDKPRELVDPRRAREADWIARHLAAKLDQGWPIRDRPSGQTRVARPGDIAILMRTMNNSGVYERALAARGLDYLVVGGSAFYAQQEVLDVINLLTAIDDPESASALAAVLRGPFGCVSDEGLLLLAMRSEVGSPDLVRGLERLEDVSQLSAADRARALAIRANLARWRARKDRMPMARLLDLSLEESGYEAALAAMFLGERKLANIRKLIGIAQRFDLAGGYCLADLVARLMADWKDPPREPPAGTSGEAGDMIQLMTIHQAKGLEIPIVVVPDLGRWKGYAQKTVILDEQLGVVTRTVAGDHEDEEAQPPPAGKNAPTSLGALLLRTRETKAENDEAIRLFYVAVTRARDHLILSAAQGPDERACSPALRLLGERFDRSTGQFRHAQAGENPPCLDVIATPPVQHGVAPARPLVVKRRLFAAVSAIERGNRQVREDVDPMPHAGVALPGLVRVSAATVGRAARMNQLLCAVLAGPAPLEPAGVASIVRDAARDVIPALASHRIDAAIECLQAWLGTTIGRAVRRAGERVAGFPYLLSRTDAVGRPITIEGSVSFLYRDRGVWTAVQMLEPGCDQPSALARVRLSLLVCPLLGRTTVERGIPGYTHVTRGVACGWSASSPPPLIVDGPVDPDQIEELLREVGLGRA